MTQGALDLPPERARCVCWLGDGVRDCETPNECGIWRNGAPRLGDSAAIKPSEGDA